MTARLGLAGIFLVLTVAPAQAANVTGSWRVTISTPQGSITGFAAFRQNGGAVTGWVGPSPSDPIPITGSITGRKLTLTTHPQPGRTVAFHQCELTVKRKRMAGTFDSGKGIITFVRTAGPPPVAAGPSFLGDLHQILFRTAMGGAVELYLWDVVDGLGG